ncbi:RNA polymerase sigma-70 factor [Pedobacter sp. ASV1-7]|uniref:RNA polymerase sigma-70 factor n=1 Tax=Pedobacter sp. ASV1-7 TaxID=3145237 RepID=UPI0032E8DAFD
MLISQEYEDDELLDLLRQNSQVALKHIYNKYWKRLYLSAYSILREDAAAQDIVQDVLLQLWIRRNESSIMVLKPYLFTAIRYKVLTHIRAASSRKIFLEPGELELLAGKEEMYDKLNESDINNLLDKSISELPERCRQIFVMSRKEYLGNKEIAEKLNITVKAVEAQITLALKQLRISMGDFLFWTCILAPIILN